MSTKHNKVSLVFKSDGSITLELPKGVLDKERGQDYVMPEHMITAMGLAAMLQKEPALITKAKQCIVHVKGLSELEVSTPNMENIH